MPRWLLPILFLAACGGSDSDEPVPATPLAGTLNDVPWAAGGAKAMLGSDPGERSIHIHPDPDLTCESFGDEPYVAAILPWVAGTYPINLESDATVFIYFDATAYLVLDGRIELVTAPTEVGADATVRIRAVFEDSDDHLFVEGEIPVRICE